MALATFQDVDLAFGGSNIFDKLNISIQENERIALLGRNGAGKTTLMRLIAGEVTPDSGNVVLQKGLKVAYLPQNPPEDLPGAVFDIVLSGLGGISELLSEYHHIAHMLHLEHSLKLMRKLEELQKALDHAQAWNLNNLAQEVISKLKLNGDDKFNTLSGGQKRRVMLARALILKPDLLLLDEPTNHLDIDSITWLEEFLKKFSGSLFFITHDRMFMANLATRVLELDRGKITSWPCDYYKFLERKAAQEEIEAARLHKFDKHLEQEEEWVRRGVQARRCRDQGRVNALEKMRTEKRNIRKKEAVADFTHQDADISGHLVAKIMHISFSYGDKCLIDNFTSRIMRSDKIGVIGPNGCGKTTFLKILLGQMEPTKGKARLGTNLEVAYFDQMREQLDDEKTLAQNICGNSETVIIDGKPRNIIGYLQDFLFSPDKIRGPVKVLSGGERNRLLLARLFTCPSNFLIMDEPTNDLDMETLELLEDLLVKYPGTLIIVSHDRQFLNNVVASTIVFEGEGRVNEYAGGYDDYLIQSKNNDVGANLCVRPNDNGQTHRPAHTLSDKTEKPKTMLEKKKLGFNETRELNGLPQKIEALEGEQKALHAKLADVNFYKKPAEEILSAKKRLGDLETEIKAAYARWEYLSSF